MVVSKVRCITQGFTLGVKGLNSANGHPHQKSTIVLKFSTATGLFPCSFKFSSISMEEQTRWQKAVSELLASRPVEKDIYCSLVKFACTTKNPPLTFRRNNTQQLGNVQPLLNSTSLSPSLHLRRTERRNRPAHHSC